MGRCRKPSPRSGTALRRTESPLDDANPAPDRVVPAAFVCGPCR
jgi:hypothetical protein